MYVGTGSSSKKNSDDPFGIGAFICGCIMIPFTLVFLWKNEKKIVTYAKCMDRAEKDVSSVDCNNVSEDNNYKLVHTGGKAINNTELVDNQFGVSVENSYRLKRIVEVYQWVETQTKKDDKIQYYYNQRWSQ